MFELDGRHLKVAFGKDYIDRLLYNCDQQMIRLSLEADDRLASSESRVNVVENRVDLVRRDLGRTDQRVNVVVARAAEDGDAILNEKYVLFILRSFLIRGIFLKAFEFISVI